MTNLELYFTPVESQDYKDKDRWQSTQIGQLIDTHIPGYFPELKGVKIAVFNVSEYEGSENSLSSTNCKIRNELYHLHHNGLPRIADLGMVKSYSTRKESFNIVELVCSKLLEIGIIPVLIGGGNDLAYAVYKAYASLNNFITLSSIDNKFDIGLKEDYLASSSYLGKIIGHKPSYLFHYVNLGYQIYYNSPMATTMLQEMNFEAIRLGVIKENISYVEPIMRNTDFISFDISSISNSYAPANIYASPNGFNGQEACKISYYAGISDKLTSFGLFEYNQDLDKDNKTAQLIAQIIWHFIDGYSKRKNELQPSVQNCIQYNVSFDDGKNEIIFYKSKISGRWWMGVPYRKKEGGEKETYFVACSYEDYETSIQGEVPERWIKTFNKLTH